MFGVMGAAGVGGAYVAGRTASQVTQAPVSVPVGAAVQASLANAASQHAMAGSVAASVPIDRTLLHAAAYEASTPFRLIDPANSTRDLDCLTAAVYYEARGETAAGQAAVAQVVLNRVRHPAFPKTVCGVVYQGAMSGACQFSFACDRAADRHREVAAWNRARDVAQRALGGYVMTGVGRATHFHIAALGAVWGGQMVRVAQIGQHIFYGFSGRRSALTDAAAANSTTGAPSSTGPTADGVMKAPAASPPPAAAQEAAIVSAAPATAAATPASATVATPS
jgi:spore germination cell wall hydrolase CwlJ-like protein